MRGAEGFIDFRTLIPGILDIPAYRADGLQRVSGDSGCMAQLYGGLAADSLSPIGSPIFFGTGEHAGYIWSDSPITVMVPGVQAGSRVWVQVRAWEPHQGGSIPEVWPPPRFMGQSEVFSLEVSETPTPLLGLKPFRFQAAALTAVLQGGAWVLRWSAGDGSVNYALEETSAVEQETHWRPAEALPVLEVAHSEWSWVADWVVTNTVTSSATFFRIRLLNP
jgi:hypothetical protein